MRGAGEILEINGKNFFYRDHNESARTAAEPWGFKTGASTRRRSRRVALTSLGSPGKHPFAGMYWWKWFPETPHHEVENYTGRQHRSKL
jgi:hypothetical protein